jgi:hypothetical protein
MLRNQVYMSPTQRVVWVGTTYVPVGVPFTHAILKTNAEDVLNMHHYVHAMGVLVPLAVMGIGHGAQHD